MDVLIVWDSMTGNVKRFVDKLEMNNVKLNEDLQVNEPFVLITYTIRFGDVPKATREFLEINHQHLKGVASSGNRNWGNSFAKAGETVSNQYNVPLLLQFELSGSDKDIETFKERLREFERH